MKYYLGIDGGGTKTSFVLIDENKNIIERTKLGATAVDSVSIKETAEVLKGGIKHFNKPIEACFAGIGGVGGDKNDLIKNVIQEVLPNSKVEVGTDSQNALIGAFGFGDGIAVICGTGSVTFGKWKGKRYVAGGYGHNEGDPGSAFSLGIGALRYLARVFDGRKEETEFSKDLAKAVNCSCHGELCEYFKYINRTEVAKLSMIVTKNEKDKNAREIIENSVDELLEEIIATTKKLSVDRQCPFCIIGSLGNADAYFKAYLIDELSKKLPQLKYQPCLYDADVGAALKAMTL